MIVPPSSRSAMVDAAFPIATPALRLFPTLLLDKFDNIGKAEALAAKGGATARGTAMPPVLLAHGTEDEIVPYSQVPWVVGTRYS